VSPKNYSEAAAEILQTFAGLDPHDVHGEGTPVRWLSMLSELTQCRRLPDPEAEELHQKQCIKWKTFPAESDDMVIINDIEFVSVCNHHVVPFIGKAHIGYVPNESIAGLSKFPRVVQHYARQLQVQERMTQQITEFLELHLEPKGVMVVLQAQHLCMAVRGVRSTSAYTTTNKVTGVFADHTRTAKVEFLRFINGGLK
jgi:GTP cyclohydrolase I